MGFPVMLTPQGSGQLCEDQIQKGKPGSLSEKKSQSYTLGEYCGNLPNSKC